MVGNALVGGAGGVTNRDGTLISGTRQRRIESIDLLRGVVMVLMALDHTRYFLFSGEYSMRDVHDPALFLTRWITHFCAPVFVFLAGSSAWLYGQSGRARKDVSRFLLARGLFLVLLELVFLRMLWTFELFPEIVFAQVIWVIGWSMVILSVLVYLPPGGVGLGGLAMIAVHDLLRPIASSRFGSADWLWTLLHEPGLIRVCAETQLAVSYTIIPWLGVMAAGYGFGPLLQRSGRQRLLGMIGLGLVATFLLVRATNGYGDPQPWAVKDGPLPTLLSFINCAKYPPSLLYLLMTIGPAIASVPLLEKLRGPGRRFLLTLGRVPLFFYIVHIPMIHLLALVLRGTGAEDPFGLFGDFPPGREPGSWAIPLRGVYLMWISIVIGLYPLCHWFDRVKQQHRDSWLAYV